eukprot:g584.t1
MEEEKKKMEEETVTSVDTKEDRETGKSENMDGTGLDSATTGEKGEENKIDSVEEDDTVANIHDEDVSTKTDVESSPSEISDSSGPMTNAVTSVDDDAESSTPGDMNSNDAISDVPIGGSESTPGAENDKNDTNNSSIDAEQLNASATKNEEEIDSSTAKSPEKSAGESIGSSTDLVGSEEDKMELKKKMYAQVQQFQSDFVNKSSEERMDILKDLKTKNEAMIERCKGKTKEEIKKEDLVTTEDSVNVALHRLGSQIHWNMCLQEKLKGKSPAEKTDFFREVRRVVLSLGQRAAQPSTLTAEEMEAVQFYSIRMSQVIPLSITIPQNCRAKELVTVIPSRLIRNQKTASPRDAGRYFVSVPVPDGAVPGQTFEYELSRRTLLVQRIPDTHKSGQLLVVRLGVKNPKGENVAVAIQVPVPAECKPGDRWCMEQARLLEGIRNMRKEDFRMKGPSSPRKAPTSDEAATSSAPSQPKAEQSSKESPDTNAESSVTKALVRKTSRRTGPSTGSFKEDFLALGTVVMLGALGYAAWRWMSTGPRAALRRK